MPKENSSKESDNEVIEIPVGKWLVLARQNPWFVSSIVLGLLLIGVMVFGTNASGYGSFPSQASVAEDIVAFFNEQVGGGVVLNSIENKGAYYELMITYDGQTSPIHVTLDGKNIIYELIPITSTGVNPPTGEAEVEIPENAYIKGELDAPVTIVEFSDFECPFCERFYSDTLPLIEQNYIETGKVRFIYMHYPLASHPQAQKAAEASECAGEQGMFWEMHDKLFENQVALSVSNYKIWAGELGLDSAQFDSCLDTGKYASEVQSQLNYGTSIGVTGTPGFFINGISVSGAQPYSVFEQIIESELAKI